MEFDLYEGQFQLGDDSENGCLDMSGLNEELNRSSTCWGEDSRVNMGTVRIKYVNEIPDPTFLLRFISFRNQLEDFKMTKNLLSQVTNI